MSKKEETQWPRFQVFKQDTPESRHLAVGTIHAPDSELALMYARDVFVRRPECFSLWVAPDEAVVILGPGEIPLDEVAVPDGSRWPEKRDFQVFSKPSRKVDYGHAGAYSASHPADAVMAAAAAIADAEGAGWMVVADEALAKSDPEDAEAWFGPARSKAYRQSSFYSTDTLMREAKRRKAQERGG